MTFLFDKKLSLRQPEKKQKTCFVDSFNFFEYDAAMIRGLTRNKEAPAIDIPIYEFINYVKTDKMVYYYGSETVPPCDETVTWIVNLTPHVITSEQLDELHDLFLPEVKAHGGNNREVFDYDSDDRMIYKFSNPSQMELKELAIKKLELVDEQEFEEDFAWLLI